MAKNMGVVTVGVATWYVNMKCVAKLTMYAKCLVLLYLTTKVVGWNNEDLELFDIVEEVNQNFYDVLGVSQVIVER